MPSDDGLGLDENQCRSPPAPGGRQQNPEHSITGAEVRPLHASLQGSQLVAEGQILEDDIVVAAAGQGNRPQEQQCQCKHVLIVSGVAAESNTRKAATTFWRTTSMSHPVPRSATGSIGAGDLILANDRSATDHETVADAETAAELPTRRSRPSLFEPRPSGGGAAGGHHVVVDIQNFDGRSRGKLIAASAEF